MDVIKKLNELTVPNVIGFYRCNCGGHAMYGKSGGGQIIRRCTDCGFGYLKKGSDELESVSSRALPTAHEYAQSLETVDSTENSDEPLLLEQRTVALSDVDVLDIDKNSVSYSEAVLNTDEPRTPLNTDVEPDKRSSMGGVFLFSAVALAVVLGLKMMRKKEAAE